MINILHLLIHLVIICNCSLGTAQKLNFSEYDKYYYQARLHFTDENYEQSIENFTKAFQIKKGDHPVDYLYAAAASLRIKDIIIGQQYLINSITKGHAKLSLINSFGPLQAFQHLDIFCEINENYNKYEKAYYDGLAHPKIITEIDSLVREDKLVRTTKNPQKRKLVDSLNIYRLMDICKQYGWQSQGWLLLWHHRTNFREDNSVWNFFRPLINNGIKEGRIRKSFWALYEDETLIYEKGVQKFGTYFKQLDEFPIQKIKNIDSLRKSIDLPPLSYLQEIYDIKLPEDYNR